MRSIAVVVAGASLSLLLAGCTTASEGSTDAASDVATAASWDDFNVNMIACMREAGWEVEEMPDGSLEWEVPDAQAEAANADDEACLAKFGYDQPPPPMDQEQAEAYLAGLEDAAVCVEDLGYEVPDQPPASQSLDGLMSPDLDPRWDVYAHVPPGDLADTQLACPSE